ncbi:sodium-dependent transporter [Lactimicrobium massiliense]|uniref:sodium-dependent transporter n=1 Tax=Lactimicrobium massiliense TaxID=2161814 RepID=UPI000D54C1AC|nr:sodium-dependent transporter [Lactimicrobium massiliense]
MKRDQFQSRLGFLLVSAGCAIGIGNVWKFPFVTGQNGGGIFVLFYLLFLIIMGIPVLTMELAIGRASRQSAVKGYKTLEKPGSKFHIHGWFCAIGCYLLMMYYTTVSGWMLGYFFKFLTGTFTSGMSKDAVSGVFSAMLANSAEMALWMAITVIAGFLIVAQGLQNGLERISRLMMVSLLCLIVVLAIHSLTLKGGMAGLQFYLLPSLTRAEEAGLGNVINAAMNQSFFTLSLGIGAMEIFGSYMSKDRTLASEAGWICVLDTFVAIVSGLIIFPACSAFGVQADAGPSLIFITLPNVFVNMAFGRLWGALFFLFMSFASFSTVIAVFENLNATLTDNFGITRKKASFINLIVVLLASLPCVLGFNVWSNFTIAGKGVLDIEDFLVSNLFLPLGSLVMVLFCSYRFGWGFDNYQKEANTGKGVRIPSFLKYYFRFGLPILVLVILIKGLM